MITINNVISNQYHRKYQHRHISIKVTNSINNDSQSLGKPTQAINTIIWDLVGLNQDYSIPRDNPNQVSDSVQISTRLAKVTAMRSQQ